MLSWNYCATLTTARKVLYPYLFLGCFDTNCVAVQAGLCDSVGMIMSKQAVAGCEIADAMLENNAPEYVPLKTSA